MNKKNKKVYIYIFIFVLFLEMLVSSLLLVNMFRPLNSIVIHEENSINTRNEVFEITNISLSSGVYDVCVFYHLKNDQSAILSISDNREIYKGILTNDMLLTPKTNKVKSRFWLIGQSDILNLKITSSCSDAITVDKIIISEVFASQCILFFSWIIICIICDCFFIYLKKVNLRCDGREHRYVFYSIIGITLVVSLPLFVDYCLQGINLEFYLQRIEEIKNTILNGYYSFRSHPDIYAGVGLDTTIYNSDVFLIVPAVLRMIGFPIQTAYQIFLLIINFCTAFISYQCFLRIFSNLKVAVLCSLLYTWSPYRIFNLYVCADLGIVLVQLFLPIVFLGFYYLYTMDVLAIQYKNLWIVFSIGFSCIIQSHFVGFLISNTMGFFLMIIMLRKTIRKETFFVLIKTFFVTFVINLPIFVLNFQNIFFHNINHLLNQQYFQSRGIYLINYLLIFFRGGDVACFDKNGILNMGALGIGLAVMLLVCLYIWQLFTGRYQGKSVKCGIFYFTNPIFALGIFFCLFCSHYFPWDYLYGHNIFLSNCIYIIQTPARFLIIVSICFTFVSGVAMYNVFCSEKKDFSFLLFTALIVIAFITTQFLIGDLLITKSPVRIYDVDNVVVSEFSNEFETGDFLLNEFQEQNCNVVSNDSQLILCDSILYIILECISGISFLLVGFLWIWRFKRVEKI